MDTWEIVIVIVLGVLLLLFLGGLAGNARMRRASDHSLTKRIAEVDAALAAARAEDRGWDPALLEQAARTAVAGHRPGVAIESLELIQVVDMPGTDNDRARMRIRHADGVDEVELHRTGDRWEAV